MSAEEEMRMEGNKYFSQRQWRKAMSKYTACIDALVSKGESSAQGTNLVLAYSNRAEAQLQLGEHSGALADTERALAVDAGHVKSLGRKARALHGLKLFRDALKFYRSALEHGGNATLESTLQEVEVADKQTRSGVYDLDQWWATKPGRAAGPPALEDYIGPVELRRGSAMDRGVYLLADVEAGQLLLVANPLFLVPDVREVDLTAFKEAIERAQSDVSQLGNLQFLVQLDTLLGPHPQDSARDVPSMRFLKPLNSLEESERVVSNADLEHPAIRQHFSSDDLIQLLDTRNFRWTTPKGVKSHEMGIYSLPSLINHSCVPNMHLLVSVGAARMGRASRRMKAGEELLLPYMPVLCPLKERKSYLAGKFVCSCERCVLEESLLQQVPGLAALEDECSKLWLQEKPLIAGMIEEELEDVIGRCLGTIKRLEKLLGGHPACQGLENEKKNWIRASFSRLHMLLLDPGQVWEDELSLASRRRYKDMVHKAVAAMCEVDPASSEAFRLLTHMSMVGLDREGRPTFAPDANTLHLAHSLVDTIYGPGLSQQAFDTLFNESG